MDDRRYHFPARTPGLAVADEQPVSQQRCERIAHLRALALEAVVLLAEGELDGFRAVAEEGLPQDHSFVREFELEGLLFPHFQEVAPRHPYALQNRRWFRQPRRVGGDERALTQGRIG